MAHKKNHSGSSSNDGKQMQEDRMSQEQKNTSEYSQSQKQGKKK